MDESERQVMIVMRQYGGSFVKALADAFIHADDSNFVKLKNAFPEYWEKYQKMAEAEAPA